MRKFLCGLLLLRLLPCLHAQPDYRKLAGELGKTTRPHPYLMFTAEEKPALLQRIKADPRSAEALERLLLEGRRLLYATAEPTRRRGRCTPAMSARTTTAILSAAISRLRSRSRSSTR